MPRRRGRRRRKLLSAGLVRLDRKGGDRENAGGAGPDRRKNRPETARSGASGGDRSGDPASEPHRETPDRDAVEELEKEIARLTVRLDEWKRTAAETPEHEAEEKTAALPAVTEKHAVAAVREAKEPKKPEQLSDKDKALMTERLAFCQTV